MEENRRRGKADPEFELIDTGIFSENRYFDVFVEYAKASTEDILIRVQIANRGPDAATLEQESRDGQSRDRQSRDSKLKQSRDSTLNT